MIERLPPWIHPPSHSVRQTEMFRQWRALIRERIIQNPPPFLCHLSPPEIRENLAAAEKAAATPGAKLTPLLLEIIVYQRQVELIAWSRFELDYSGKKRRVITLKLPPKQRKERVSATITPTLGLMACCSAFLIVTAYASDPTSWNDPGWWSARGAVLPPQVVTNSGVVTTNYIANNNAVVNQGELKQFTARAADELNADLTNAGGAGAALSNLVYGWHEDYVTNGYATNTANPSKPYKPSDFTAVNVGQLKYIASLVDGQLAAAGYTGLYPSWIVQNTNTDNVAANLGQLKEVFDYDLSVAPSAVSGLNATAAVNEIDLTWTLPAMDTATSLVVQESTNGGSTWTTVATLAANATAYAATGLTPGTNYLFNVTSINPINSASFAGSGSGGGSTSSPSSSASPTPAAPTGLAGSMDTSGNMHLSWTASANATSYVIEREILATGVWSSRGTSSTTTYEDTTDPQNGVHYRVQAVNGGGEPSPPSNEYPTLQYAVIDLGTNNTPVAFNNAGSVVLQMGTNSPYTYGYWTNGAVAAPIPLTNVVGMNNSGVVVGTTGTNITLYSPRGPGLDPDYVPVTYTPASSWSISGVVSQVGPNPTSHVIPSDAGGEPPNPLSTTHSGYLIDDPAEITSTPVGITDGGSVYGSMSEFFRFADSPSGAVSGGCMATLYNNSPLPGLTVGSSDDQGVGDVAGTDSWLTAVNASGQAVGYSVSTVDGAATWVAYDGTTFRTLNGIPLNNGYSVYIANNYSIVGPDSTYTNALLFTNGATTGVLLTNIAPGPINASNQIIASGNIWQTNVATKLDDVNSQTNWNFFPSEINDGGAIAGVGYPIDTNGNYLTNAASHGAILLPIQSRVVNRDDPTQMWANNVLQSGIPPLVYGGITAGDMVGWKLAGTDSWTSAMFTWTVTDNSGNPVTDFNGTTITGPSGAGVNEWRIATWSAGGNDPNNQWLTWKPGTYNIKCVITWAGGGTAPITFQQTVGNRTKDVLVVGWINPAGVSLPTSGVDSDVLSTFPVSGTFGGPLDRTFASGYMLSLAAGITLRPVVAASLSSADDTYILNWLFHFAGNSTPPTSFANESAIDAFVATKTNYKLVNRFQAKWQESSGTFQSSPTQIKDGLSIAIGTTTDPIWGLSVPGQTGPANGRIRITTNNTYSQMNDGSPDSVAVAAFNTLMSPNQWSDIGSRIDFGITINQGTPPIMGYTLENQVYPTYNVYVRNSDGSFTQINSIPQAANPSGNFSSSPYPPTVPSWVLP